MRPGSHRQDRRLLIHRQAGHGRCLPALTPRSIFTATRSSLRSRYDERSALGVEDGERAARVLAAVTGARLTYRRPY